MAGRLQRALSQANPAVFTVVAGLAGFSAYFSMYAFRKPFAAATFDTVPGWSFALDYKVALVVAQVAGYALSKFIGVKVISEIEPRHRAWSIIGLIGVAWLALIGFALTPAPWNVGFLLLNGLPLGMIWGLVYGFMEGRRVSEVLAAILCASFILSSGVVKSVGLWLMQTWHVSAFWMPAATGALFIPLLLASVWVLSQLPPPDARDQAERVRRAPMTGRERAAFLRAYAPGLIPLVLAYVLLTAFRDYRDNFAAEIWTGLGFGGEASLFTASELPVAIIALVGLAAIIVVKDNRRALMVIHAMVGGGFVLLGLATLAFQAHIMSALAWMILAGSGLYIAYNPINAALFDRLVAASGEVANAGFLIYVADSSGYMGSVALLLWRNFGQATMNWLQYFIMGAYVTSVVGAVFTAIAALYFHRRSGMRQLKAALHDGVLASGAGFGLQERFQHGDRLGAADGEQQAGVQNLNAGLRRDLGPHLAGAACAPPHVAVRLAGHRDEAEVADRGAVGLGVAVDHHDALAAPGRRQRAGQPYDAGADNGQVERARGHGGPGRCRDAMTTEVGDDFSRRGESGYASSR